MAIWTMLTIQMITTNNLFFYYFLFLIYILLIFIVKVAWNERLSKFDKVIKVLLKQIPREKKCLNFLSFLVATSRLCVISVWSDLSFRIIIGWIYFRYLLIGLTCDDQRISLFFFSFFRQNHFIIAFKRDHWYSFMLVKIFLCLYIFILVCKRH